jgi:drug/metabolite transporter (DMT)-like permease
MMRLVMLSVLQSGLSVGGITVLHELLHDRSLTPAEIVGAFISMRGLLGIVLLILAFLVMSYMLTDMKVSVFVPLNTATTFLTTTVAGLLVTSERPSLRIFAGMVLVVAGIAVITAQRP